MKERIGFFGGAFNPPTKIHIELANNLIRENQLDKVVFVPVGDYYQKTDLASAEHRYNMLKIATEKYRNIELNDIGLKADKKLYAVDIFKIIAEKYADKEIYFIMGSDNYKKMSNWKDYEIIKGYDYIVLERNEEEKSSSQIREMIKRDVTVEEYLDLEVGQYIKEKKLYKPH